MERYSKGSHTLYHHRYHLVWITKYRYRVLRGELQRRVHTIIAQVAEGTGVKILNGVVSSDHSHLFVSIPPLKAQVGEYGRAMSDTELTDEQWKVLEPLLPPQPSTGRRREHDQEVLNSIIYRLKTGIRYKDLPKTEEYAARSTVYYWLRRWTEEGVWDGLFQKLLGIPDEEGKLSLDEGALDGSFVSAKRGATASTMATKQRAQPS